MLEDFIWESVEEKLSSLLCSGSCHNHDYTAVVEREIEGRVGDRWFIRKVKELEISLRCGEAKMSVR
jgi:hypothetical protein